MKRVPSPDERQRRIRIIVTIAAYAYEFRDHSLISDANFDRLSLLVDKDMVTGDVRMDKFFKKHFQPHTGMWIRLHPDLSRVEYLYEQVYKTLQNIYFDGEKL